MRFVNIRTVQLIALALLLTSVLIFSLLAQKNKAYKSRASETAANNASSSNWEIYNNKPILVPELDTEIKGLYAPWVIKEGDTWKMWYGGFNGTKDYIHYAVSSDGLDWKKAGPVKWLRSNGEEYDIYEYYDLLNDPSVAKVNGYYYMYFTAVRKGVYHMEGGRVHVATSADGFNWIEQTKDMDNGIFSNFASVPWEKTQYDRPSVIYEDNMFKMWYDGTGSDSIQIGYATSTNGIDWTPYKNNPVFSKAAEVGVQRVGNTYFMVFGSFATYDEYHNGVYLATSPDGVNWTKYGSIIPSIPGSPGYPGNPMLFTDNGQLSRIYFSASDSNEGGTLRTFVALYKSPTPTPTLTPTVTPTPTSYANASTSTSQAKPCSIQGYKVINPSPGSYQFTDPAASQAVTLDSATVITNNPFTFSSVSGGTHTISVPSINGYKTGYTLCYNDTSCYNSQPVVGDNVQVNCDGGYVNLWWYYMPSEPRVNPFDIIKGFFRKDNGDELPPVPPPLPAPQ